jgi:hypothetical protein
MKDISAEENHVFLLVKNISMSYLKIRFHHLAKEKNLSLTENFVRKKLSKLILFYHQ